MTQTTQHPRTLRLHEPEKIKMNAQGKLENADGVLDQITGSFLRQARPLLKEDILPALQSDRRLQQAVGQAAGESFYEKAKIPIWLIAGSALVALIFYIKKKS